MKLRFDCANCSADVDITLSGIQNKEIIKCWNCEEWLHPEFDEIVYVQPHTCWILEDKDETD